MTPRGTEEGGQTWKEDGSRPGKADGRQGALGPSGEAVGGQQRKDGPEARVSPQKLRELGRILSRPQAPLGAGKGHQAGAGAPAAGIQARGGTHTGHSRWRRRLGAARPGARRPQARTPRSGPCTADSVSWIPSHGPCVVGPVPCPQAGTLCRGPPHRADLVDACARRRVVDPTPDPAWTPGSRPGVRELSAPAPLRLSVSCSEKSPQAAGRRVGGPASTLCLQRRAPHSRDPSTPYLARPPQPQIPTRPDPTPTARLTTFAARPELRARPPQPPPPPPRTRPRARPDGLTPGPTRSTQEPQRAPIGPGSARLLLGPALLTD